MGMKITAKEILPLLLQRHEKDICVPECKTGQSWGEQNQRIDLWVMKASWAKPQVTAYEIKISRQDFIRDGKWRQYLDYCNCLYFVAPTGIIDPSELPADVGLLCTSTNATRLYTKRKAVFRPVAIPESIYRYILMWRAKIQRHEYAEMSKSEYWRSWLEIRDEEKELGHNVSVKIAKLYRERVLAVREENERLKSQNAALEDVRTTLTALGLDPKSVSMGRKHAIQNRLREIVTELNSGIPNGLLPSLKGSIDCLRLTYDMITKHIGEEQ